MTDKPIPFSGPMVRAILEGRKTQTRRVLKDGPEGDWAVDPNPRGPGFAWVAPEGGISMPILPPYAPGDRLWVREAWRAESCFDDCSPRELPNGEIIARIYEADGARKFWKYDHLPAGRYRQARFMPRWASRLTLTVTDVRVQRLQDISERDAIAEGVADGGCTECGGSSLAPEGCCYNPSPDFKDSFAFIWDSLNAKPKPVGGKVTTHYVSYPWAGEQRTETHRGKPHHIYPNPWVCAVTFTAHRCNIDQME